MPAGRLKRHANLRCPKCRTTESRTTQPAERSTLQGFEENPRSRICRDLAKSGAPTTSQPTPELPRLQIALRVVKPGKAKGYARFCSSSKPTTGGNHKKNGETSQACFLRGTSIDKGSSGFGLQYRPRKPHCVPANRLFYGHNIDEIRYSMES